METNIKGKYNNVFDACISSLEYLDIRIEFKDKSTGEIEARTKSSLRSWGEDIYVKVKKINEQICRVTIESDATAQLFSWGRNAENENDILKAIKDKIRE